MKSNNQIDDETLGRWLAGELKGNALKKFELSDEFQTYKVIADYSNTIKPFDYDSDLEFKKLKTKIDSKSKKGKVINFNWVKTLSIAASIALLFGIGFTFFGNSITTTKFATLKSETKTIELPNHSIVNLNIASTIEYNEQEWNNERIVSLEGEAYFDVTKGRKFIVKTTHGNIEVLGTEFNIRNRGDFTEVICFEGKVKVTDLNQKNTIITPGEVARIKNGTLEDSWAPKVTTDAEWKKGFSSFQNVSLLSVFKEIENQYNVEISIKTNIKDRMYVGAFPHNNLEQALKLVCGPMQLNFTITDTKIEIKD